MNSIHNRINWIRVGAFFAAAAVGMGAFGAHALKNILDDYSREVYAKAVLYQMFHTFGIFAVGILVRSGRNSALNIAAFLFSLGIILFSGSLYILSITGVRWLGMITPLGGLCFISGWLWILFKSGTDE